MTVRSYNFHAMLRASATAGAFLLVLAAWGGVAQGVACPSGGAKVDVCVFNPTASTSAMITVTGQYVPNEITCTGPAPIAGSYSSTFTVPAGQTVCTPGGIPANGLVSGMYVHRIQVPGTTQSQYQQRPVLASSGTRTRIDWTYMPTVMTVNVAGDSGAGTCPLNSVSNPATCDIRTAAAAAKLVSGTQPVLIQLATSPGAMTGLNLQLERDNLTIDGTDASGNPWIVGDANAAAAGNQDPIPRALVFNPFRSVWIRANNVTLKGMEIRHALGAGEVSGSSLVVQFSPFTGTTLDSVRLDASNLVDCTVFPEDCEAYPSSLVTLQSRTDFPFVPSLTMTNVEGRSALYQGVDVKPRNELQVDRSWLRNNYHGNVRADAARVTLERSVIERAGLRASDDRSMITTARGIYVTNSELDDSQLSTVANVVRNNRSFGVSAAGIGNITPKDDAICGNGATGFTTSAAGGLLPSVFSLGGLTTAYNAGHGVRVGQDDFTAVSLNDDSAFTANALCGLFNTWIPDAVSAVNNQWRGSAPYVDTCVNEFGAGPVAVGTPQDPNAENIVLGTPAPSNVILKGQTIRVLGEGFNAITGNPLAADGACTIGVNTSGAGQGNSCCNKVARANECLGVNQPVDGGGNCVELRNGLMQWHELQVKAVTPRMIEAQVPNAVFNCLGNSMELVRVHKKFGLTERLGLANYCTQTDPL